MDRLEFEDFYLVRHDRGSYAVFRTALDYPSRVLKWAVLDGVPVLKALERCNPKFASKWWHWFLYAHPDKPELAILSDPAKWYQGSAVAASMGNQNHDDSQAAIHDPETVISMLGDYRAAIAVDQLHDREDREAGRKTQCPLHVIWSLKDDLEHRYGDVLAVWWPWVEQEATGVGVNSGHCMAKEAPTELAKSLKAFFYEI